MKNPAERGRFRPCRRMPGNGRDTKGAVLTSGRTTTGMPAVAAGHEGTYRIARISAFAALAALAAQMAVRLPYTPVPVTMQTLVVVLAGMVLGPRDGFYAMCAYIGAGVLGTPVFAGLAFGPAVLFGPTGGYIIAFPAAALAAGSVFRSLGGGRLAAATGALAGSACIIAGGTLHLMLLSGLSAAGTAALSALPFMGVELFKAIAAAMLAGSIRTPRQASSA